MSTEPCWICGHGPHRPTSHAYLTEREAWWEISSQPAGSEPQADEALRFPGEG